ncbi:MAG: ABC transporter permease [Leeuwenhoekiella sp.]
MLSLFRENLRIAFDAIRSQSLRTILTVLIIAIGITALVAILSLVTALKNTLTGNFTAMGSNTIQVQRYATTTQRRGSGETFKVNPVISYRQAKEFEEVFDSPLSSVSLSFTGSGGAEVSYEGEKTDPEITVLGVNENFIENSGLKLDAGRNFTIFDISNNVNVCILGSDLKNGLFKGLNPLDQVISIRGTKFKVIGLLEEKGSTFGNSQDQRVLIPIQTARSIYTQPRINYELSVMTTDPNLLDATTDNVIMTMRNVRGLTPVEENNFGISRSDDLLNQLAENTKVLSIAAWVISMITIFGSSIALMNIMLVSVTERTREIGVRKALGAKKGTIAGQFLMETIIIGQLGGALGIILGILIGMLVANLAEFDFTTPWGAMIAAVTVTFIVAIISGFFPAIKAAKLDPIESLRYE